MAGLAPATPVVADHAAMLKFFITTNLDTKFLVSLPAQWDVFKVKIKEFQDHLTEVHGREFPAHRALQCQGLTVLDGFKVPREYTIHEAFTGLDRRICATFLGCSRGDVRVPPYIAGVEEEIHRPVALANVITSAVAEEAHGCQNQASHAIDQPAHDQSCAIRVVQHRDPSEDLEPRQRPKRSQFEPGTAADIDPRPVRKRKAAETQSSQGKGTKRSKEIARNGLTADVRQLGDNSGGGLDPNAGARIQSVRAFATGPNRQRAVNAGQNTQPALECQPPNATGILPPATNPRRSKGARPGLPKTDMQCPDLPVWLRKRTARAQVVGVAEGLHNNASKSLEQADVLAVRDEQMLVGRKTTVGAQRQPRGRPRKAVRLAGPRPLVSAGTSGVDGGAVDHIVVADKSAPGRQLHAHQTEGSGIPRQQTEAQPSASHPSVPLKPHCATGGSSKAAIKRLAVRESLFADTRPEEAVDALEPPAVATKKTGHHGERGGPLAQSAGASAPPPVRKADVKRMGQSARSQLSPTLCKSALLRSIKPAGPSESASRSISQKLVPGGDTSVPNAAAPAAPTAQPAKSGQMLTRRSKKIMSSVESREEVTPACEQASFKGAAGLATTAGHQDSSLLPPAFQETAPVQEGPLRKRLRSATAMEGLNVRVRGQANANASTETTAVADTGIGAAAGRGRQTGRRAEPVADSQGQVGQHVDVSVKACSRHRGATHIPDSKDTAPASTRSSKQPGKSTRVPQEVAPLISEPAAKPAENAGRVSSRKQPSDVGEARPESRVAHKQSHAKTNELTLGGSPDLQQAASWQPQASSAEKRVTRGRLIDFKALANVRMLGASLTMDEAMRKTVRKNDGDGDDDDVDGGPSGKLACLSQEAHREEDTHSKQPATTGRPAFLPPHQRRGASRPRLTPQTVLARRSVEEGLSLPGNGNSLLEAAAEESTRHNQVGRTLRSRSREDKRQQLHIVPKHMLGNATREDIGKSVEGSGAADVLHEPCNGNWATSSPCTSIDGARSAEDLINSLLPASDSQIKSLVQDLAQTAEEQELESLLEQSRPLDEVILGEAPLPFTSLQPPLSLHSSQLTAAKAALKMPAGAAPGSVRLALQKWRKQATPLAQQSRSPSPRTGKGLQQAQDAIVDKGIASGVSNPGGEGIAAHPMALFQYTPLQAGQEPASPSDAAVTSRPSFKGNSPSTSSGNLSRSSTDAVSHGTYTDGRCEDTEDKVRASLHAPDLLSSPASSGTMSKTSGEDEGDSPNWGISPPRMDGGPPSPREILADQGLHDEPSKGSTTPSPQPGSPDICGRDMQEERSTSRRKHKRRRQRQPVTPSGFFMSAGQLDTSWDERDKRLPGGKKQGLSTRSEPRLDFITPGHAVMLGQRSFMPPARIRTGESGTPRSSRGVRGRKCRGARARAGAETILRACLFQGSRGVRHAGLLLAAHLSLKKGRNSKHAGRAGCPHISSHHTPLEPTAAPSTATANLPQTVAQHADMAFPAIAATEPFGPVCLHQHGATSCDQDVQRSLALAGAAQRGTEEDVNVAGDSRGRCMPSFAATGTAMDGSSRFAPSMPSTALKCIPHAEDSTTKIDLGEIRGRPDSVPQARAEKSHGKAQSRQSSLPEDGQGMRSRSIAAVASTQKSQQESDPVGGATHAAAVTKMLEEKSAAGATSAGTGQGSISKDSMASSSRPSSPEVSSVNRGGSGGPRGDSARVAATGRRRDDSRSMSVSDGSRASSSPSRSQSLQPGMEVTADAAWGNGPTATQVEVALKPGEGIEHTSKETAGAQEGLSEKHEVPYPGPTGGVLHGSARQDVREESNNAASSSDSQGSSSSESETDRTRSEETSKTTRTATHGPALAGRVNGAGDGRGAEVSVISPSVAHAESLSQGGRQAAVISARQEGSPNLQDDSPTLPKPSAAMSARPELGHGAAKGSMQHGVSVTPRLGEAAVPGNQQHSGRPVASLAGRMAAELEEESEDDSDNTTDVNQISFFENEDHVILPVLGHTRESMQQEACEEPTSHLQHMLDDPNSLEDLLASMVQKTQDTAGVQVSSDVAEEKQTLDKLAEEKTTEVSEGVRDLITAVDEAGPTQPAASVQQLPSMADAACRGGLNLNSLTAYGNLPTVRKALKAALTCFLNLQLQAQGACPQHYPMKKVVQPDWWPYNRWNLGAVDQANRDSLASLYSLLQSAYHDFLQQQAVSGNLRKLLNRLQASA